MNADRSQQWATLGLTFSELGSDPLNPCGASTPTASRLSRLVGSLDDAVLWPVPKGLASLGVSVRIDPMPMGVATPIRCDLDSTHCTCDGEAVKRSSSSENR